MYRLCKSWGLCRPKTCTQDVYQKSSVQSCLMGVYINWCHSHFFSNERYHKLVLPSSLCDEIWCSYLFVWARFLHTVYWKLSSYFFMKGLIKTVPCCLILITLYPIVFSLGIAKNCWVLLVYKERFWFQCIFFRSIPFEKWSSMCGFGYQKTFSPKLYLTFFKGSTPCVKSN